MPFFTLGYTANNLIALLSGMNSKITDVQTQHNNVGQQIAGLTPASYNTNPSGTTQTFQTARTIKTGANDLQIAFSDAKQIIQSLKSSGRVSPVPTQ